METKSERKFWDLKPFWCQPWSIILTGLLIVGLSVYWPNNLILTIFLSLIILLWWYLFLVIAPTIYINEKNE